MPFVHIRIAGADLTPTQIEGLQTETTRLMADVMHKKAELTAVLVEMQPRGRWSIGGISAPVAAHLDVKVTAGTNSSIDKADFIRHAHDLLAAVMGAGLSVATYVVIDEIAADAWGYGGLTQEVRRIAVR